MVHLVRALEAEQRAEPPMAELVLVVMLVAATLYAVFGGADFGVGMIEPFLPRKDARKPSRPRSRPCGRQITSGSCSLS